jgi:hypothetical protein
MSDDPIEERREMLEQLAERDDLRCQRWAKQLLEGD